MTEEKQSCLSAIPPDQAEGDVKDMIYQIAGIAFFVREIPNQVGNDITDKFQCDSGSQAGMTEGLRDDRAEYHKHVRGENRSHRHF